MGSAYTVALVGFAQAESATFESFFRLAARRPPAYRVQDEVMDAQILIVNSDNAQALHLVRYAELPGKVLLVGHSDGGTGWPLQRKPVKLVSVLAALDAITGAQRASPARSRAAAAPSGFAATEPFRASAMQGLDASMRRVGAQAPAEPPMRPVVTRRRSADTEFPATRPMPRESLVPPAVRAPSSAATARLSKPGVMRLTDFGGLDELPSPAPAVRSPGRSGRSTQSRTRTPVPEVQRGDVLLVAESLVEGRILHKRFGRYKLSVDWSRESAQALVMLKAHPYRLVVIDRLSGEPDAYQVCRAAKQVRLPNGQSPVVVMFASTAGSMDRIKAGLAGSDAYFPRSVNEAELYRLLAQHRLVDLDGFEKTNVGF
jgi:CheY-like chemotaxis protein